MATGERVGNLLTVPEAARRLRVSPVLVYTLAAAGEVPAIRISRRRRRVPEDLLEQWLLSRVEGSWTGAGDGA